MICFLFVKFYVFSVCMLLLRVSHTHLSPSPRVIVLFFVFFSLFQRWILLFVGCVVGAMMTRSCCSVMAVMIITTPSVYYPH